MFVNKNAKDIRRNGLNFDNAGANSLDWGASFKCGILGPGRGDVYIATTRQIQPGGQEIKVVSRALREALIVSGVYDGHLCPSHHAGMEIWDPLVYKGASCVI